LRDFFSLRKKLHVASVLTFIQISIVGREICQGLIKTVAYQSLYHVNIVMLSLNVLKLYLVTTF